MVLLTNFENELCKKIELQINSQVNTEDLTNRSECSSCCNKISSLNGSGGSTGGINRIVEIKRYCKKCNVTSVSRSGSMSQPAVHHISNINRLIQNGGFSLKVLNN